MGCGSVTRGGVQPKKAGAFSKSDVVAVGKKRFTEFYTFQKKNGLGTYAEVWTACNKNTKDIRAVKVVKKSLFKKNSSLKDRLHSEFETLIQMDSPNIMKIYETYEDDSKYYIVIELMKGLTLMEYIQKVPQEKFTESFVAGIMKQVLVGLNHCHSLNIVHRDIKPENLMFQDEENKHLKIIDFGFAKLFTPEERTFRELLGSPMYIAPEIVNRKEYDTKCDIWSLGIICYILLCGEIPYKIESASDLSILFEQIKKKKFAKSELTEGMWKCISEAGKDFVLRMLEPDPSKRSTAHDLLCDPWLSKAKAELIDPEGTKESLSRIIKSHSESKFQHAILTFISHHADLNAENKKLTDYFNTLDKDGNHILSKEELKKGFNETGFTLSDKEIDSLFEKIDTNKSGGVNYTEFLASTMDLSMVLNDAVMHEAFSYFDKDGSNSLDRKEISCVLCKCFMSDHQISELFEEIDTTQNSE